MHPSLAYMTLGMPKHVVAAILIGGGPNALSIRPTGFVMDEAPTHNPEIMRLMLYRLSYNMKCIEYIFFV